MLIPEVWTAGMQRLVDGNGYEQLLELEDQNLRDKVCQDIADVIKDVAGQTISYKTLKNYFNAFLQDDFTGVNPDDKTIEILCSFILDGKADFEKFSHATGFFEKKISKGSLGLARSNNPFEASKKLRIAALISVVLAALIVVSPLFLGIEIQDIKDTSNIDAEDLKINAIVHCAIIGSLLFAWFFTPIAGREKILSLSKGDVKDAIRQFLFVWEAIWISWLLLYIWFWVKWEVFLWEEPQKNLEFGHFYQFSWAVADALNVLSSIFFLILFFVMDQQNINGSRQGYEQNLIQVLAISLIILLISVVDRYYELRAYDEELDSVLSVFTAVSMMFFFGRLDSKYFKANRLLLIPLYVYSSIQIVWSVYEDFKSIIFFLWIALMLKIFLFLAVIHWITNGNFQRYFEELLEKE